MSATIAYYQHMIDLYNAKSRTEAWDIRLEKYRKWIQEKKQLANLCRYVQVT